MQFQPVGHAQRVIENEKNTPELKEHLVQMQKLFLPLPKVTGKVRLSIDTNDDVKSFLANLTLGAKVEYPSFLLSRAQISNNNSLFSVDRKLVLEIDSVNGRTMRGFGIEVNKLSPDSIIFLPGTQFEVLDIKLENQEYNQYIVKLKDLGTSQR